jgi:hypothetical protein
MDPATILYIVTLILSIALAPKPKAPKSASIEDFSFPTAEEGRAIPVVFGDIEITGPNVLWYGDLSIVPIKKRAGFSKATVGFKYHIGFHLGLCHGPVDAVTRVRVDKNIAWTGSITSNDTGEIDLPNLFGGESRGGGLYGEFDIEMGASTQPVSTYLAAQQGANVPAYRGVTCFVWKTGAGTAGGPFGFSRRLGYIGNSEAVRPFGVRVTRILAGWEGTVWYPDAATVDGAMNPAHIIYQVLTDSEWGMGISTALIDEATFTEAADTFVAESFGLNLIWNQTSSIEQFLQVVLNHVNGSLSLRLDTGKYRLTLFRGGYDASTLPLFDQSNVIDLRRFERRGWGETVNEVTVIYTDPASLEPTAISAQDLGNVDAQGSRIPEIVEFPGIRNHDIARATLGRELAARSMPLTKIQFTINRAAWDLSVKDLFRFTWPERDCTERVFRALKIGRGTLQDNTITIEAIEDIFQYSTGTGLSIVPAPGDTPNVDTPALDDDDTPAVISATTTTPPSGSPGPQNGDRYYVPAGATGAWSGHTGQLAEWDDDGGGWAFTDLPVGTIFQVLDTCPQENKQVGASGLSDLVDIPLSNKGDLLTHDGSAPADLGVGDDGQILFADSSKSLGIVWKSSRDIFTSLSYSKENQPSTDTISNSTSVVSFASVSSLLFDSFSLPRVGDVIVIRLAGTYGTTGTPTLSVNILLGSVTLASSGSVTMGSGISNRGWNAELRVSLMSTGSSGTVEAHGVMLFSTAVGTTTVVSLFSTGPITVDTNTAASVSATAQWSSASASNTITLRQFSVEYLNVRQSDAVVIFVDASGTTIQTSSTTVSETIPALTVTGDLILAFIMHRSSLTPPSGWTLVATSTCTNSTVTQITSVYKRTAVGGDAGSSPTWTQASAGRFIAHINTYRGLLAPADVVAFATSNQSSATTNLLPWATVAATSNGQIGIASSSIILANVGTPMTMTPLSGTLSTPSSVTDNRLAVCRIARNSGQTLVGQFTSSQPSTADNGTASVSVVVG